MQQIITAKLKLITEPEQFTALRKTQLAYRDALNAVSRYAFSQGKTSSVTKLHKGMFAELRARYHLPSQLACSVERQVAATYKGLWTKLKKNVEHRRAKITKKRGKRLGQASHVQFSNRPVYPTRRITPFSATAGSVSAPCMGASAFPIRAMTSISHVFGREPPSVTRNSGMAGKRNSSIYSFPSPLTYLSRPVNNSPKLLAWMRVSAIWL
jgi:hypothetical protein